MEQNIDSCIDLSERQFREILPNIFDAIPDGVFVINRDFSLVKANRFAKKYYGNSILGCKCYHTFKKITTPCERCPAKKSFQDGKQHRETTLLTNDKGETTFVEISTYPVFNAEGEVCHVVEHHKDVTQEKLTQKELIESKERYQKLYQNFPSAYQSLNESGHILDVNAEWLKIVGYQREEVIGRWFGNFLPDGQQKIFRSNFEEIKKQGSVNGAEYEILCKSGNPVFVTFDAITDYNNNRFLQVYCSFREITREKELLNKLKEKEEKLKIRNQLAELFIKSNYEDIFHEVLEILLTKFESQFGFFGYINQNGDLVSPTMTRGVWEQCQMKEKNIVFPRDKWGGLWGKSLLEQSNYIKNEGLKVPHGHVSISNAMVAVITFDGKLIGQIALANTAGGFAEQDLKELSEICNYISPFLYSSIQERNYKKELIKSKKKAEENENKFKSLFEFMQEGAYLHELVFDKEGKAINYKVINANPISEKYLNIKPADAIGKLATKLFQTSEPPFLDVYSKVVDTGKPVIFEEYFLSMKKWFYISVFSPEKNHFATIFRDITAVKQHEYELKKAKDQAEKSDRLKSAFLANISHEIRTPMNGIIGFTELLKEPDLTNEMMQYYIEVIHKSGERLLHTIDDLVDISKIETGVVTTNFRKVDIHKEMNSFFNFFKSDAEKNGIELKLIKASDSNKIEINTDRGKLCAIFTKLLKNAIKYTENGSISFGVSLKDQNVEFFVKDTGKGIPSDKQETIFDPFVQVSATLTRNYEGSGLGLSIAKAYVEMLGGKIWLESEEGKGACFYFSLPC